LKPLTGSAIQLDTETDTRVDTSNGDHDKFAHYADKDEVTYALIYGVPIIALCGKKWIPSRDPNGFSICPTCQEVFASLPNEGSDDYSS
jgi:hypothetical protein